MEGQPVEFLVDTSAQHSVLTQARGPLSGKKSWVLGATGQKQYAWTTQRMVDLGVGRVNHSFLVILECPTPLLGRDILTKVGAQISFQAEDARVTDREKKPLGLSILSIRLEDEYHLFKEPGPS